MAADEKSRVCRVLLIDDNPHGLTARRDILAEKGYTVTIAESGEEGIGYFENEPFDLVVTDYRMPGVRGDEVVRRVKLADPNLPVVILSGYTVPLALTVESTGADLVLAKGPREHNEPVRAVETLLPANVRPRPIKPASERQSSTGVAYSRLRSRGHSA